MDGGLIMRVIIEKKDEYFRATFDDDGEVTDIIEVINKPAFIYQLINFIIEKVDQLDSETPR